MRTDPRLIPAAPAHLRSLTRIAGECFPDPWPEAVFARRLGHITAAEVGGEIVGYIAFSSVLDEGSVDDIAVLPAFRRQGVADLLLGEALRAGKAAGLAAVTLEVRAGNAPAAALYRKHGFREVGRRKNYYAKPREDAVLMTVTL